MSLFHRFRELIVKHSIPRRSRPRNHVTAWSSSSSHVWEMVLADGDCSCTAIMSRITMCRNMGYMDFTSPDSCKGVTFPNINVYAKMWLRPHAVVSVWFDKNLFSPLQVLKSLRTVHAGESQPEGSCIEHVKHSSRFFCGTYAYNTTSDIAFSADLADSHTHRQRMLLNSGYTLAHCIRWRFKSVDEAIAFFDQIAVMMRRMEHKRCLGCFNEIRCRVGDACDPCHGAAVRIQRAFRRAMADPHYFMCRRRLLREADEMMDDFGI
jgi:hypothetical protein